MTRLAALLTAVGLLLLAVGVARSGLGLLVAGAAGVLTATVLLLLPLLRSPRR